MKDLREKMSEISSHLQDLMNPEVFPEVQNAVEAKDKDALVHLCGRAGVPQVYITAIVSVLLAIGPQQKWPLMF